LSWYSVTRGAFARASAFSFMLKVTNKLAFQLDSISSNSCKFWRGQKSSVASVACITSAWYYHNFGFSWLWINHLCICLWTFCVSSLCSMHICFEILYLAVQSRLGGSVPMSLIDINDKLGRKSCNDSNWYHLLNSDRRS
jgi:hypothetical protein